jgi:CRISPR-associated endonuclease Csn1
MDALVLTFDWVNKLKGKRTALQFIQDMSDDERFHTPKRYKDFVNKIKVTPKGKSPDDHRRQSARKKWLLIDNYEAKDHGFTQAALSQTSHLNRLSQNQIARLFTDPETGDCTVRIHALPGQVTAEIRKAWNVLHALDKACPECKDKNKTDIRDITHLHHALDASVLGLTQHYLPGIIRGQKENEKGAIWKALLKRNKSPEEISLLMSTGVFQRTERIERNGKSRIDTRLIPLPDAVKNNLSSRLAEKRVVQHIPADQSGAILEETTWRLMGTLEDYAVLTQRVARTSLKSNPDHPKHRYDDIEFKKEAQKLLPEFSHLFNAKQKRLIERGILKLTTEPLRSVIGIKPGKLSTLKAVRVISRNYGIALGSNPQIIPHHSVSKRLDEIAEINDGKLPPIIKIGSIIRVTSGTWQGTWRVISVKESKAYGLSVDLATLDGCKKSKGNAKIPNMIEAGLGLLQTKLTGINPSD